MNAYFALRYLNEELKPKVFGSFFSKAVSFQKNLLFLFFDTQNETVKLTFSSDTTRIALFLDNRLSEKKKNSVSFFDDKSGQKVIDVQLDPNDRFIYFEFEDQSSLVFRLFGTDPNVLLVADNKILDSFKNPAQNVGLSKPKPFLSNPPIFSETRGTKLKRVFRAFPKIPRDSVRQLFELYDIDSMKDEQIQDFFLKVEDILINNPEFRVLSDGSFSLLPDSLFPDEKAEKFNTINDAIRVAFFKDRSDFRFRKEIADFKKKLEKQYDRLNRVVEQAENAYKSLERAEQYEQYGNILLANAHLKNVETDTIDLDDLYNPGEKVTIQLKSDLDIAGNAKYYFDKKKKSERSYEVATAYAESVQNELDDIRNLREDVQKIDSKDQWLDFKKEHENNSLFTKHTSNEDTSDSRPFKIIRIGKYEVWIGKNAKSNDEVLRQSHKEDIWMHARGVSGSHVVIRMNKVLHDPDLSLLETVGSWAAWFSKGKGMSLVPVIWTRRKFVRKPKGGAPGAAKVDKENTILVPPIEPENKYYE